jgi:hypothetical protein
MSLRNANKTFGLVKRLVDFHIQIDVNYYGSGVEFADIKMLMNPLDKSSLSDLTVGAQADEPVAVALLPSGSRQ